MTSLSGEMQNSLGLARIFGFRRVSAAVDGYLSTLMHESRHCWQATALGQDIDHDFLFEEYTIPPSSADLYDAPNHTVPGGSSGDGYFRGDDSPDGDSGAHVMQEHNAMRFEQSLGFLETLECAYATFDAVSDDPTYPAGSEPNVPFAVKVMSPCAAGEADSPNRCGVTIRFEVIDPSANTTQIRTYLSESFSDVAYGMTGDQGEAWVYFKVGTVDTKIRMTLVPPMAPQDTCPNLVSNDPDLPPGVLEGHVHVQQ